MILPAPKWFGWIYAVLFWLFLLAALFGGEQLSATAYVVLMLMFFGLAVFWLGAVVIRSIIGLVRK